MPRFVRKCPFVKQKIDDDVRVLDYRHSSLQDIPAEVFDRERTLEELHADSNQIRDLPRELFFCHGLRKLSLSDNEIINIPPAISSLANLEELDFSKNGVIEVPDSIKGCKYLRSIDASVNPLGKLPEGFTQLANLTHLYLNDTFLDYLPGSCGRMVTLKILELRENHIKTLPRSFGRLIELERLDIGNNEFTELPEVIGELTKLLELWCDHNQMTSLTPNLGHLQQLMFLDASKNQLHSLPDSIQGCVSLADLHLTSNNLVELPDSIGNLANLTTLKVDDNQLMSLPKSLGRLSTLSELNVSTNNLRQLPASIGLLRNLRTLYADENLLQCLPSEMGSCSGITVLSLRNNKLTYIPDELGRIPRLRVLNISNNLLSHLPFSVVKLKELQALWLAENQTRPLIPLQSDYDSETGRKILTCYLLPQGHQDSTDARDSTLDGQSFHASTWDEDRLRKQLIHFSFGEVQDEEGRLIRCPTPYPKEMRDKVRHARNLALRQMIKVSTPEENTQGLSESKLKEPTMRPVSPGRQETHRLYRFDKEKLLKDKKRMQHRLSVPEFAVSAGDAYKEASKQERSTTLSHNTGSVPDLTTATPTDPVTSESLARATSLTIRQFGHHHRSRGSRRTRIREYDSDLGYRSDGEAIRRSHRPSSDIMSVQSQPVRSGSGLSHNQWRDIRTRRGLGYASDVEGYAGGETYPTANAAIAAFQRKHQLSQCPSAQSVPHNLHRVDHNTSSTLGSLQNYFSYSPSKSEPRQYYARPGVAAGGGSPSSVAAPTRAGPTSDRPHSASSSFRNSNVSIVSKANDSFVLNSDPFHPNNHPATPDTPHNSLFSSSQPPSHQASHLKQFPASSPRFHSDQNWTPGLATLQQTGPVIRYDGQQPSAQTGPETNNEAATSSSRSPSFTTQNDSFLDFSHSSTIKRTPSKSGVSYRSFSPVDISRGSNLYTLHERSGTHSDEVPQTNQAVSSAPHNAMTPPAYVATPPYRKPDNKSPGLDTSISRLSSHSSSSRVDSPRSATGHVPEISSQTSHNAQPLTSASCGFHGNNPYSAFLESQQQKLNSSDYADIDSLGQSVCATGVGNYSALPPASRYDTWSSHTASASQLGPTSSTRLDFRRHDQSNSSDSRSDAQNYSFSRDSPHSHGDSAEFNSRRTRSHNHQTESFISFNEHNYEDLAASHNPEQSSQVSSSTDSGYGPGHRLYEHMGDYYQAAEVHSWTRHHQSDDPGSSTGFSPQSSSREADGLPVGSVPASRAEPLAVSDIQEHATQFRVTIYKNPDLGFSIAGGVDSQGNPYRSNIKGIFVTKVMSDGPASKLLQPGDRLLQVNQVDFRAIEHSLAVKVLKSSNTVDILVERVQTANLV